MAIDEVLLIGGAAGVGKTTTGWEISAQLARRDIAHWHLEGDVLDAAWPRPTDDQDGSQLSEHTLAAMAHVFVSRGYRRLVFVQTYALMDLPLVRRALGEHVRLRGVLLTATEPTRIARLEGREIGSELARHVERGARMAVHLDESVPGWVQRVATDHRTVADVAHEVIEFSEWPSVWPDSDSR